VNNHRKYEVRERDELTGREIARVPLDAPRGDPSKGGHPRMPEAIRAMTSVVKLRQQCVWEFFSSWPTTFEEKELDKLWYPRQTSRYNPTTQYRLREEREKQARECKDGISSKFHPETHLRLGS
jgi:hypothetical protein